MAIYFLISTCKGLLMLHITMLRVLCHLLMKTVTISLAFVFMPRVPPLIYPKRTMAKVPWEAELSPYMHCLWSLTLGISGKLGVEESTFLHWGQGKYSLKEHSSCLHLPFPKRLLQPCLLSSFAMRKC